jgi:hypothetical protein
MSSLLVAVLFGFLTSYAVAQPKARPQDVVKSSKLVITVDVATGKVSVTDEKGNPVKPVDCNKLKGIPQYYDGVITYYKTNPDCVCYNFMGTCFPVCTP